MPAGQLQVRAFAEKDRAAIRKICSEAALEKPNTLFHEDRELAPLFFADCYMDYEPDMCFVGEVDGQVVGYQIGCKDTRRFSRIFQSRYLPRILARIVWKILTLQYRKKATYLALWWSVTELFRRREKITPPMDEYPAHSHFNVAAGFRGGGIGHLVSMAFRQRLQELGVRGQHSFIIEEAGNSALSDAVCRQRGFKVAATQPYHLLEKMTGKQWHMRLMIYDLRKEQERN
jgi:hypothetical protein